MQLNFYIFLDFEFYINEVIKYLFGILILIIFKLKKNF